MHLQQQTHQQRQNLHAGAAVAPKEPEVDPSSPTMMSQRVGVVEASSLIRVKRAVAVAVLLHHPLMKMDRGWDHNVNVTLTSRNILVHLPFTQSCPIMLNRTAVEPSMIGTCHAHLT